MLDPQYVYTSLYILVQGHMNFQSFDIFTYLRILFTGYLGGLVG